jgi:hypothetical protein
MPDKIPDRIKDIGKKLVIISTERKIGQDRVNEKEDKSNKSSR